MLRRRGSKKRMENFMPIDGMHIDRVSDRRRRAIPRHNVPGLVAAGSSGIGRQHLAKPLSKYLSAAENGVASEPSSLYEQPDASCREGKVRDLAAIATSNRSRHSSACRTRRGSAGSGKQDAGLIVNVGDAFGDETSRYQIRGAKLSAHHADSFGETSKIASVQLHQN